MRLGDRVSRGQRVARIEDFEIQEQVKQAEAAQEVSMATIRQREADLQLAQTNAERSRNLFERQLLPKQTLDDNESRYQSALASLDLAKAQASQSKARLDELRINLGNTIITSPVNGFVSKRLVDPGAFVSQNAPIVDVVDITTVRLVANIVEKDLKELQSGDGTKVEVDAYPGEEFMGRIARVSPVLDPATRTAPIEIEIPNPRLPPQARHVCTGQHPHRHHQGCTGSALRRGRGPGWAPRGVHAAQRVGRVPRAPDRHRSGQTSSRSWAAWPRATSSSPPAPARCVTATAFCCQGAAGTADGAAATRLTVQDEPAGAAPLEPARAARGPPRARRPRLAGTLHGRAPRAAAAAAATAPAGPADAPAMARDATAGRAAKAAAAAKAGTAARDGPKFRPAAPRRSGL